MTTTLPPTQDVLWPEHNPDNAAQGTILRDDGIARADAHVEADWRSSAESALRYICEHRQKFTSDPIWTLLEFRGCPPPHDKRALGGLMKAAVGWGWCSALPGEWSLSVRPECHRRPLQVYRSHLYAPDV